MMSGEVWKYSTSSTEEQNTAPNWINSTIYILFIKLKTLINIGLTASKICL